jgi:hypothetical protein
MKDKNDWNTQEIKIKIPSKHKRSQYAFTENSKDSKAKTHYIKHCKILKNVTEAKKQDYSRLIAKSNNKIKATWNILKTQEVYI